MGEETQRHACMFMRESQSLPRVVVLPNIGQVTDERGSIAIRREVLRRTRTPLITRVAGRLANHGQTGIKGHGSGFTRATPFGQTGVRGP